MIKKAIKSKSNWNFQGEKLEQKTIKLWGSSARHVDTWREMQLLETKESKKKKKRIKN